jgi:hypothetical protein
MALTLCRNGRQELLAKVLDRVQVWLGSFNLSDAPGSDIMELC